MTGVLEGFATIVVLIALGGLLGHLRIVDEPGRHTLSTLSFYVASPALLLTVMEDSDLGTVFSANLVASAVAVAVTVVLTLAATLLVGNRDLGGTVVAVLCTSYVNAGNLGLPIAAYVLDDVTLVAPILLVQLLVLQPLALTLLDVAVADRRPSLLDVASRPVRNPLTIATLLGVLLSATGTQLPAPVQDPLDLVGGMTVPAMLIAYGVALRLGPLPGRGVSPRLLTFVVVVKQVVQPLAAYVVGRAVGLPDPALLAVTVLSALPTAQNIHVIAMRYGRGELLARVATTAAAVAVGVVAVAWVAQRAVGTADPFAGLEGLLLATPERLALALAVAAAAVLALRVRSARDGAPGDAVLGVGHPGELLDALEDRVQEVGRGGVLGVDVVVHAAGGAGDGVERGDDPVDGLGRVDLVGRELRERRLGGDGLAAGVGQRVHGAHPLGDVVGEVAGGVDDLVELQVEVAEVLADDVPVGLLALDVEVDEVDEDGLEARAELLGGAERGGGGRGGGLGHLRAPSSVGAPPVFRFFWIDSRKVRLALLSPPRRSDVRVDAGQRQCVRHRQAIEVVQRVANLHLRVGHGQRRDPVRPQHAEHHARAVEVDVGHEAGDRPVADDVRRELGAVVPPQVAQGHRRPDSPEVGTGRAVVVDADGVPAPVDPHRHREHRRPEDRDPLALAAHRPQGGHDLDDRGAVGDGEARDGPPTQAGDGGRRRLEHDERPPGRGLLEVDQRRLRARLAAVLRPERPVVRGGEHGAGHAGEVRGVGAHDPVAAAGAGRGHAISLLDAVERSQSGKATLITSRGQWIAVEQLG